MMTGFGSFGLFLMVVFWGALIFLVIWLVKAFFPGGQSTDRGAVGRTRSPMEILDERYAHGEITREQYETMKRDIS